MQGDGDQERLKRQQELTALNLYQLQQLQYQYLLRYTQLWSDTFYSFADAAWNKIQIHMYSLSHCVGTTRELGS